MNFYGIVTKQFAAKKNQPKKVGLEVELPLVKQTGEAMAIA